MTRLASTGSVLLAICAAFAGCSARTNVSVTASTPAQFTHVFITAQAVWFNTNASAGPDDAGWVKFELKNPVTVDLVTESNGSLGEVANDLRVAPGTYNSILLLPVPPSMALTDSATAVGAVMNQEVDYVDSTGKAQQAALILPNQEKGIVIPGSGLTVPVGGTGGGLPIGGAAGTNTTNTTNAFNTSNTTNTTNTTNNASTLFGSPTTVNPTTPTASSTTNNTVTVSFGATFDGNRDLHTFGYSFLNSANQLTGVFLSASGQSSNLSKTGGITGTLSLTSLNTSTTPFQNASGRLDVQACAESLSSDGSHHVVVACAPVQTDGTFTIYPLPSDSRNPVNYDVVIHGSRIATIIIKSVVVTTTTPSLTPAATTNGSVATTTASGAVSLGSIIPRQTITFPVNATAASSAVLPAGAAITFYQSLSGAVPYVIDEVGIDPFNTNGSGNLLNTPEFLSAGTIDTGTYNSNGGTITITSSQPANGPGTYAVAAVAPLYADGIASSSANVVAPASTQGANPADDTTTPVNVAVPGLTPSDGSSAATLTATITASSPGRYTQGQLLVSRNGAVVGSAPINSTTLQNGGTVQVAGLPTGNTYYLSAIVWNSAEGQPLVYQPSPTPVALSGGSASAAVTIN
jgi:hypothetical protein